VSTSWAQSDEAGDYKWNPSIVYKVQIDNEKVQQQLRKIHEAKTATVMFIEPYMIDPPRNEAEFQESACKYTVYDRAKLANLEELLINAKTRAREKEMGGRGFGIGIYLTLQDNSVMRIRFDESAKTDKEVWGKIEKSSERQMIIADADVVSELYQWAAATGIQTYCNAFFK
jgi:hypothetical protein